LYEAIAINYMMLKISLNIRKKEKLLLQIAYMKNSQIIQYPIIVTNAIIHFLHSKKRGEIIAIPRMLYPKPSIRQQLSMLYQRPGFEDMLKLSGVQREGDIYSDIYDGKIWKTFPFDGSTFFTSETATTHLGLLFNLDWFQPFTYTQHSTGAIYASICNLPRSERNKPENIIYLGFLPGPKKVGLERINHYVALL